MCLLIDDMNKDDTTVGGRIYLARMHLSEIEGQKISQAKLAELCGWMNGQTRIGNYEKNVRNPDKDDITKIAKACGVRPEWIQFKSGPMTNGEVRGIQETASAYETIKITKAVEFKDIPRFVKEKTLPPEFQVTVNINAALINGVTTLNCTTIKNDDSKFIIGIYQGEADLFEVISNGVKWYLDYADPNFRDKPLTAKDIHPVAWVLSVAERPLLHS